MNDDMKHPQIAAVLVEKVIGSRSYCLNKCPDLLCFHYFHAGNTPGTRCRGSAKNILFNV